MILSKDWNASLYNDPWRSRRRTEEITVDAGTPIRDIEYADAGSAFPPFSARVQIGANGEWYLAYSYTKPLTE